GTMAHSFIQAHGNETEAFREYARLYPGTTLLVDTWDTLAAVERVIALHCEMGEGFRIGAIRIDSGDFAVLAQAARTRLDAAGLKNVKIVASGGLDEYKIAKLVEGDAPIDAYGVGTSMGTSADAAYLDLVYKLTLYDGEPRVKDSPGKPVLPGAKQVFRYRDNEGRILRDEITLRDEMREAKPLLVPIVRNGEALAAATLDPKLAALYARGEIERLPESVRSLEPGDSGFTVDVSDAVTQLHAAALAGVQRDASRSS